MHKLPLISGIKIVKIFVKVGYEIDHQTGSHIILRHKDEPHRRLTIPNHKEVDRGTLRAIIKQAGLKRREFLEVEMAPDSISSEVEKAVAKLEGGDVLLLENIRFHPEEEANDASFAKELARLADIFVNDAFGASHRTHASVAGVAGYLPAVAGLLVEKEIKVLGDILANPAHPFAELVGAKVLISGHEPCPEGCNAPNDVQVIIDCCGERASYVILPVEQELSHAEVLERMQRLV